MHCVLIFLIRSDDKGMEPESLSILTKGGNSYAFVGFDRTSLIVVFDITDPVSPTFVEIVGNNPTDIPAGELFEKGMQGDMDPEGLFASGKAMKLFVAGSVSSTLSSYDIEM